MSGVLHSWYLEAEIKSDFAFVSRTAVANLIFLCSLTCPEYMMLEHPKVIAVDLGTLSRNLMVLFGPRA